MTNEILLFIESFLAPLILVYLLAYIGFITYAYQSAKIKRDGRTIFDVPPDYRD